MEGQRWRSGNTGGEQCWPEVVQVLLYGSRENKRGLDGQQGKMSDDNTTTRDDNGERIKSTERESCGEALRVEEVKMVRQ